MLGTRRVVPSDARFIAELFVGIAAYALSLRVLAPRVFHELLDTAQRVIAPLRRTARPLAEGRT